MSKLYDDCPMKAPKLLKVKSLVETCSSCGAWVERYPEFLAGDYFWECEKCGCTSVKIRQGRPYSKKSREWENITNQFNELFLDIPYWDWDSIETEPPMKSLDWVAVEQYFNSQNIYRVFMGIGLEIIHVEVDNG